MDSTCNISFPKMYTFIDITHTLKSYDTKHLLEMGNIARVASPLNAYCLRPHNFRTDLARNTIRRQGPLEWNGNINKCSTVKCFNKNVKEYLL